MTALAPQPERRDILLDILLGLAALYGIGSWCTVFGYPLLERYGMDGLSRVFFLWPNYGIATRLDYIAMPLIGLIALFALVADIFVQGDDALTVTSRLVQLAFMISVVVAVGGFVTVGESSVTLLVLPLGLAFWRTRFSKARPQQL